MKKITKKPFNVIGLSIRTTNENNQSGKDIAELWQLFLSKNIQEQIPNKVDNSIYCVYTDYEKDHTKPYTTILGCKVSSIDKIPEGMVAQSFKKGIYIKTIAKGDLTNNLIYNHWLKIFEMNIDRAFFADFEIYDERANNPKDCEVDVFVSVK